MAQSAVTRHLDGRAAQLLTDVQFTDWAHLMTTVIEHRDFLARRLREWELLRAVALHEPWSAERLTCATDWFQRKAATMEIVTSHEALSLLAERGRTRRVRNAASRRMKRLGQSPD